MLKFKLDAEKFGTLNEVEQSFYAKSGDGYQLQVEGATDKAKLDEFRASNVDLLKQQEAYKGIDVSKYRDFEEQARKIKDKEFVDAKDIDGLIAHRTNSLKSDMQGKIDALTGQLNDSNGRYNGLVTKTEIEGAANVAFSKHSIRPTLSGAAMLLVKNTFSIDNGQVVAKDGDNILTGANGNLTVSEFVDSLGEDFKIPSNGGGGAGSAGTANPADKKASLRAAYQKMMP
tara:strand:+ start:5046 stop:5735 length:690 start_codon:yes stop_codon:yes gene_type:complete